MQPGGPIAIQRQASEQDHAGDGVVGHANAGAREVVMHKALTLESGQQALHEPVFEMQRTVVASSDPGSENTIGRIGFSLRHSHGDWLRRRGGRKVSSVPTRLSGDPARISAGHSRTSVKNRTGSAIGWSPSSPANAVSRACTSTDRCVLRSWGPGVRIVLTWPR